MILDLANNAFTGRLPDMNHFPNIRDVYVQQNAFSGTIPNNFASSLSKLDISSNRFTGSIPSKLFQLPFLELFGASLNCVSEQLPESICQARNMKQLYLDGLGAAR